MKIFAILALFLPVAALAYEFDSDVPPAIQTQTNADLSFIRSIRAEQASVLHKQIYGAVDGDTYSRFFDAHIESIGLSDCGDPHAVACVIPLLGRQMFLTDNYIKFSHPQIARLMVLFHEARHTEREHGNWSHASCPVPFLGADGKEIRSIWTGAALAGAAACDITPLGSYGSSTILLKNVSKFCTNCSEKVRMDAGIYADDQYKRVIDERAKSQMYDDLWRS